MVFYMARYRWDIVSKVDTEWNSPGDNPRASFNLFKKDETDDIKSQDTTRLASNISSRLTGQKIYAIIKWTLTMIIGYFSLTLNVTATFRIFPPFVLQTVHWKETLLERAFQAFQKYPKCFENCSKQDTQKNNYILLQNGCRDLHFLLIL